MVQKSCTIIYKVLYMPGGYIRISEASTVPRFVNWSLSYTWIFVPECLKSFLPVDW